MEKIKIFTKNQLSKVTNFRSGEVKFGEKMGIVPEDVSVFEFIKNSEFEFVLFGIPEDVGVRANNGRAGTSLAWQNAISSIANIQHNKFCKGSKILVLGEVDVDQEMQEAANLDYKNLDDRKKLCEIVSKIDKEVTHVIKNIIKSGKFPIVVGGGHNNAYGCIKGSALAIGKPINAINFDAHSDFRILEGRHSGNGFSYAYEEGFLNKYFIFGLHESYTSKSVLDLLKSMKERIAYNTYDEIKIRQEKNMISEINTSLEFIKNEAFGIEIDLDALPNIASSAMTNSGFSVEELRQFIYFFGKNKNATYLHIAEGAPTLDCSTNGHLTGKLISYLITDFIKAKSSLTN